MNRSMFLSGMILLVSITSASAEIWDPSYSWATIESQRALVAPCGAHHLPRIDVYLQDAGANPYELIRTDIWLGSDNMTFCGFYAQAWADSSTFPPNPGHTTITNVGGGLSIVDPDTDCTTLVFDLVVLGVILERFELHLSSPDLNSNREVTVADFSVFATLFQSTSACADYNDDGLTNIADFGIFAEFYNQCYCY